MTACVKWQAELQTCCTNVWIFCETEAVVSFTKPAYRQSPKHYVAVSKGSVWALQTCEQPTDYILKDEYLIVRTSSEHFFLSVFTTNFTCRLILFSLTKTILSYSSCTCFQLIKGFYCEGVFCYWSEFCCTCYVPFVCAFVSQDVGTACSGLSVFITWKESLAGDRGAMGLSVLQKWMVEGRGLGVNRTGVWKDKWTETSKSVWQEWTFQEKTIDKWFNFLCGRPN